MYYPFAVGCNPTYVPRSKNCAYICTRDPLFRPGRPRLPLSDSEAASAQSASDRRGAVESLYRKILEHMPILTEEETLKLRTRENSHRKADHRFSRWDVWLEL